MHLFVKRNFTLDVTRGASQVRPSVTSFKNSWRRIFQTRNLIFKASELISRPELKVQNPAKNPDIKFVSNKQPEEMARFADSFFACEAERQSVKRTVQFDSLALTTFHTSQNKVPLFSYWKMLNKPKCGTSKWLRWKLQALRQLKHIAL